jgi:hypothetical protein
VLYWVGWGRVLPYHISLVGRDEDCVGAVWVVGVETLHGVCLHS